VRAQDKIIQFFAVTLGISLTIIIIGIVSSLLKGLVWFAHEIFPYFLLVGSAIFWLSIVIVLPLALIKKMRGDVGIFFMLSATFLGLILLIQSIIEVYNVWGWIGLLIGLILGGITIIPEAFIATILNRQWAECENLIGFLIPTLVFYGLGVWLILKHEKDRIEEF